MDVKQQNDNNKRVTSSLTNTIITTCILLNKLKLSNQKHAMHDIHICAKNHTCTSLRNGMVLSDSSTGKEGQKIPAYLFYNYLKSQEFMLQNNCLISTDVNKKINKKCYSM